MKGTKNIFTLLIFPLFFIAVAFTAGCSSPIGGLLVDSNRGTALDYIKAKPKRFLYDKGDLFEPAKDVKVIGVFGGVENEIDIDKVEIKIINDPGYAGSEPPDIVPDNQVGLPLVTDGIKDIVITYNNMETRYTIAVGKEGTNSGGGWGGGSGSGITINWQ